MGERVEQVKKVVARAFPKLNDDEKFEVTSKATPNYNCIAWAYNKADEIGRASCRERVFDIV